MRDARVCLIEDGANDVVALAGFRTLLQQAGGALAAPPTDAGAG